MNEMGEKCKNFGSLEIEPQHGSTKVYQTQTSHSVDIHMGDGSTGATDA